MEREDIGNEGRKSLTLEVYDRLRGEIMGGQYDAGARLPSEAELASLFGVSRLTVREALRMLQGDMLVEAKHGRGHYVLRRPTAFKTPISDLQSVTEMMEEFGYEVDTEVLEVAVEEAGANGTRLSLEPQDPVVRLERFRKSEGEIMIYSVDIFPASLVPHQSDIDWSGSLFALLERNNVYVTYSYAVVKAALLPEMIANRGQIGTDHPWTRLEQINCTADHVPVLYSHDYHRGDIFEFNVIRQRRR